MSQGRRPQQKCSNWSPTPAMCAADDIARKTVTGTSRARRKLSTSKGLGHQTGTDQALRHGDVSDDQADDVSDAVAASPDSEDELLDSARREPLHQLRKRAATAKARADKDREATRGLRRRRRPRPPPREIAGIGPVSLTALRTLMSDSVLALVIRDGVDIINVTHLGRQVTAHQRTALEARGGACEFCGSTFRVEIDHIAGWALTHTTTIDDLSLKCWHCHDRKTRLGLHEPGPPGNRQFLHPDGTPWQPPPGDRHVHEEPAETTVQTDLFTLAN